MVEVSAEKAKRREIGEGGGGAGVTSTEQLLSKGGKRALEAPKDWLAYRISGGALGRRDPSRRGACGRGCRGNEAKGSGTGRGGAIWEDSWKTRG